MLSSNSILAVLYRSKEPALPDFSKGDDEVGDVFFDVRVFLCPNLFDFTNGSWKPNVLSTDGSSIMGVCRFSPSGEYFVYGVSQLVGNLVPTDNCLILIFFCA